MLRLFNGLIPIRCAFQFASYHNKLIIADNSKVLTGSANFTYQADTKNAENIVIIDDAGLAAAFTANLRVTGECLTVHGTPHHTRSQCTTNNIGHA